MATTPKQRLALAICDFLSTSLTDGTLQGDDKDSIDIAINCIGEAFGVDPTDKAAVESKGNAAMAQKDYPTAIDFYTQALTINPGNAVYLSNRAAAHSAAKDHESARSDMPDLSSIMSNPMFASMAQNLMSNPDMMANLMSNPRLRQMAEQFSGGGGMPDMSALMSDPSIADMYAPEPLCRGENTS
ncbi:hypothetical protein GQ53DRAFT_187123 [Thozetella sp. PMI_491]|nr:hypothetical protein GQ53DRAFT_187123 [Thozetella sp. PMI_491]